MVGDRAYGRLIIYECSVRACKNGNQNPVSVMMGLIILLLIFISIFLVAGLLFRIFLGWTWRKYFEEILNWIIWR